MTKRKSGDADILQRIEEFENKRRKTEKMETSGDGEETTVGNTKITTVAPNSEKTRNNQYKHMVLTWNNYKNGDVETLRSVMEPLCDVFVFQEEIGENGTPHIQGCFSLKKRSRYQEFGLPKETHWEKVQKLTECRVYCSKLDTRKEGTLPYTFNYEVPSDRLIDPDYKYPDKEWQQHALKLLQEPANNRNIYWFWSSKGNVGKSTLAFHLVTRMRGHAIGGTSASNVYYMLAILEKKLKRNDIIIYDLSRDEGSKISYRAIEKIKDRVIVSTKYECKTVVLPVLHVIIFANVPPPHDALTSDRLIIVDIDKEFVNT